jgi:hypothetical protein
VAARIFEDSAGDVWEVFEVQRVTGQALGVSAGLERGWLSFVSGVKRRRLAPVPPDWQTVPVSELERLCAAARAVPLPTTFDMLRRRSPGGLRAQWGDASIERRAAGDVVEERHEVLPLIAAVAETDVERTVREFAHQARMRNLQVIDAMVELKVLLSEKYPEPASIARDKRRVRRWFVEAYYFDREA